MKRPRAPALFCEKKRYRAPTTHSWRTMGQKLELLQLHKYNCLTLQDKEKERDKAVPNNMAKFRDAIFLEYKQFLLEKIAKM